MAQEKIPPKTVYRMLTKLLLDSMVQARKEGDTSASYAGYIAGVTDCIVLLKMKYNKEYRDSYTNAKLPYPTVGYSKYTE